MMKNELIELLAEHAHNQWIHWMNYLTKKLEVVSEDNTEEVLIKCNLSDWTRWKRQMNTNYRELHEHEKMSDREQAGKFLNLLTSPTFIELFREITSYYMQTRGIITGAFDMDVQIIAEGLKRYMKSQEEGN